jgi:hypothetical protein
LFPLGLLGSYKGTQLLGGAGGGDSAELGELGAHLRRVDDVVDFGIELIDDGLG